MLEPLIIAGERLASRLIVGSAGYPNQRVLLEAIEASGAELVTASIRRIDLTGAPELPFPAQHRGLHDCARCRINCGAGAGSAGDQLGQT